MKNFTIRFNDPEIAPIDDPLAEGIVVADDGKVNEPKKD